MSNTVSANVVSVYLTPNKPLRAAVAVMDTIVCNARLLDLENNPVILTGCEVIVAATDRDKTRLYEAEIIDALQGRIRVIVQPDVPGQFKLTAKVGVTLSADEYTFFLGAFSVAADESGDPADTIHSLTDDLLSAKEAALLVADQERGLYSQIRAASEDVAADLAASRESAQAAQEYSQTAQTAAGYATDGALAAASSATSAASSQNEAAASATSAASSADAASGSAAAAAAKQEAAAQNAQSAAASASGASASASAAAGSAQSAASSEQTASQKAADAAGSASAAADSAGQAAESAHDSQEIYDNIQAAIDNAASEAGAAAASAAVAAVQSSVADAFADLFTGAQPGQVLVKTSDGYFWDWPENAPLSGAWNPPSTS